MKAIGESVNMFKWKVLLSYGVSNSENDRIGVDDNSDNMLAGHLARSM
jgi:hypothetical protein